MRLSNCPALAAFLLASTLLPQLGPAADSPYNPLALPAGSKAQTLDLTVHGKNARDIPIRVYLPTATSSVPVVLFSHGLGGSRQGSAYLGDHWAGRGYVVVYTQHPGSDTSVWQDKPLAERMSALNRAANLENFVLRVQDIHDVLDQLARWNTNDASSLHGRLDLKHIGMSGHSFGAVTAQAVSGEYLPTSGTAGTDPRIKAAIMFSPSSPRTGAPKEGFGKISIPWMLMTGTKDTSPVGKTDLESRLAIFPALPAGNKYEVVLYGAEHSAFTDRPLPGDTEKRNPNHHRVILALSTAFWDAYLRSDPAAKNWLDGSGPHSVLEQDDKWQSK
jgi:predicted dienelactone hydrolase